MVLKVMMHDEISIYNNNNNGSAVGAGGTRGLSPPPKIIFSKRVCKALNGIIKQP